MAESYDAIVIGSGPNGLAAAITIARAGRSVLVREANETIGGSCRSAELTLPGYTHDVCSTVQALALASPFMQSVPLAQHGLELIHPDAPYAQPYDDGSAAIAYKDFERTGATLGRDAAAWKKLFGQVSNNWDKLSTPLLGPFRPPKHPILMGVFGLRALRSARSLAESWFEGEAAKGLFAGVAGHSILPFDYAGTSAFALVLGGSAHAVGWPIAKGGSQKLSDALAGYLRSLGGKIETSSRVTNIDELPPAKAILCDVSTKALAQIAGHKLPERYTRKLQNFRYGPGVFKLDWALSAPIPWKNPQVTKAGTVHLGGTLNELAAAELAPWENRYAERPYVLLVQQSNFDSTRAPAGKFTAWAYCHVPHGGDLDITDRIEAQVERFAPGFKDTIIAKSVMNPAAMQAYNANLLGGDITGGANMLMQVFARPVLSLNPYATPLKGLYLCSASTPPGGGVHGMSGFHAAQSALRSVLR